MINTNLKKGNANRKSRTDLDVIKNVDKLYQSRQTTINLFIEYTERISKAKSRAKQEGTGLKILTAKQNASKIANSSCTNKNRQ